jgi:hypothetical protein
LRGELVMTAMTEVDRTRRRRRRRLVVLAAVVAAAAALVLLVVRLWPSGTPAAAGGGAGGAGVAAVPVVRGGAVAGAGASALPSDLAELVAFLRGRYGKHIGSAYVQIQMLEKLMRHFQEKNPAGWQAELLAAVRAAFPDQYDAIAANLQHRLDYEAWLKREHDRLNGLGERERRDAIWEERKRLFGDAADEIWAAEKKNQAVTDALAAIDASADGTVADRLAQYKESLVEAHQENADTYLQNHRQEALGRFLGLDSVQRELAAMAPADRAAALRNVRKGLGLDGEALGRWDTLDQERDRRWEAGRTYMAARAALAKQYAGDALEVHLQELRERYFGAEAATIAEEEASGFFRFDRARKYGVN